MIDSITRITLNLQETNTMVSIRAKRGDTGRKLLIHLSDGSIPYHISDECYATFTAKKADGTKINNPCSIENNVIEYEFTDQTCTAVGTMKAEIRLYGADDKMITSACFLVNVYDTVFRDGDEVDSEGEMNTLDDLILRANAFLNETGKLLRWQGNWNREAGYETNDLVLHEEVLYVACGTIAVGTEPGSDDAAWMPIAGMGTGSNASATPAKITVKRFSDSTNGTGVMVTTTNYGADGSFSTDMERVYDGTDGVTPKIGAVSVETIGADEKPSGSISGPTNYLVLKLKIPKGADGEDGQDYVLTEDDKTEIAEMAANLVDVPGSGGNVENGEDGFSPIATVTQTDSGAVISITDKDGTTTATITNGKDGQRGTGLLPVTTAPSGYTTAVGGITPKYRMAISTIKTQAGVIEVLLGDTVRYSYYHYPIAYLDASYAYFTTRIGIRGAAGKTAYQYAVDGGYEGTEDEFAAKLAAETVYYEPQNLTEAQKAQARENIGTVSATYLISVFTELKAAISESNIDAAVAVLDEAILDLSALS